MPTVFTCIGLAHQDLYLGSRAQLSPTALRHCLPPTPLISASLVHLLSPAHPDALLLSFCPLPCCPSALQVVSATHMRVADGVTTLLQMHGMLAKLAASAKGRSLGTMALPVAGAAAAGAGAGSAVAAGGK